jgi:hypothetical protein
VVGECESPSLELASCSKYRPDKGFVESRITHARNLDLAVERYKLARPALEQAVRGWREAVAAATAVDALSAMPKNGSAPD